MRIENQPTSGELDCWELVRGSFMKDLRELQRSWTQGMDPQAPDRIVRGAQPGMYPMGTIDLGEGRTLPYTVPLLDGPHLFLHGDADDAEKFLHTAMFNVLATVPPHLAKFHVYDPGQPGRFTGKYADLLKVGAVSSISTEDFNDTLDWFYNYMRKVNEEVLAGRYGSLAEKAAKTGERREPWHVLLIVGDGSEFTRQQKEQLQRLINGGMTTGIQLWLYEPDLPHYDSPAIEHLDFRRGGRIATELTQSLPVSITMAQPPSPETTATVQAVVVDALKDGQQSPSFSEKLPPEENMRGANAATGISVPIGETLGGNTVNLDFNNTTAHWVLEGKTGRGKTGLLLTFLLGLAAKYNSNQVIFEIHDYKGGAEFNELAQTGDGFWLPNLTHIGLGITNDPEYGTSILKHLQRLKDDRQRLFKAAGVNNYEDYIAAGNTLPRVIVLIDEAQEVFTDSNPYAHRNVEALRELLAQLRSHGVGLLLSTQSFAGIEAFLGKSSMFNNVAGRLALSGSGGTLEDTKEVPSDLDGFVVGVNRAGGRKGSTEIVRMSYAPRTVRDLARKTILEKAFRNASDEDPTEPEPQPPTIIDGDVTPALTPAEIERVTSRAAGRLPMAFLGQRLDVGAPPVAIELARTPGSHIAVVGTHMGSDFDDDIGGPVAESDRRYESHDILHSATVSVAHQAPAGTQFAVLVPDDYNSGRAAEQLARQLHSMRHSVTLVRGRKDAADWAEQHAEQLKTDQEAAATTYVTIYGAEQLGETGTTPLQIILDKGPLLGTNVIGQWSDIARYRRSLAGGAFLSQDHLIRNRVMLNVPGSQIDASISGARNGIQWGVRPNRALVLVEGRPEGAVIIPYGRQS